MQFTLFTSISLLLFFSLRDVGSRQYTSELRVSNGGEWGEWGEKEICRRGYTTSFLLKVEKPRGYWLDDTTLNGIALRCSDGTFVTSTFGPFGDWTKEISCKPRFLSSFSLRVTAYTRFNDETAANNIKFKCTDGSVLEGLGMPWGSFGEWSESCQMGGICGIQTRVQKPMFLGNDTGLNDVVLFCCD